MGCNDIACVWFSPSPPVTYLQWSAVWQLGALWPAMTGGQGLKVGGCGRRGLWLHFTVSFCSAHTLPVFTSCELSMVLCILKACYHHSNTVVFLMAEKKAYKCLSRWLNSMWLITCSSRPWIQVCFHKWGRDCTLFESQNMYFLNKCIVLLGHLF